MSIAARRVALRLNFGSHPAVARVYAYDPATGDVLALVDYTDGGKRLAQVSTGELEALKADDTYGDVDAELRRRASHII